MIADLFCFVQAFLNQHCGELVSVCEAYLASIILSERGAENLNEELMVRTKTFAGFSFLPQHFLYHAGSNSAFSTQKFVLLDLKTSACKMPFFVLMIKLKMSSLLFQVKHLHTLGVASLHCPSKVGKRTVLLVESVLTTHSVKLAGREDGSLRNSSKCFIVGNWTCFNFLKMFHLSSKSMTN